jgi:hypothetical protein
MKKTAAVLVVALALAACGGDDSSSSDDTTTTTSVDVDAMLLVPEDLNSDDALDAQWAVGDVSQGVDIVLPDCIDEELLAPAPTDGTAKLIRQTEFKLPSVEQHIGAWAGDGAKAAYDAAVARLDACDPQFTYQGAPSAGTIARFDLPAVGDESVAWRTNVTIAGAPVSITSIHVLVGDVEMSIVHTDLNTPDPAELAQIAATAADKLS